MHFHDCASRCSMIAFSHRYRRGYPAIIIITVTIILFLTCDGVYAIVWLESIGERICSQSIFIRTKMDYHRCFVFLKSFENGKIPIRMPEYSIHRSSPTYSFCQKTVRRLFPCQSQSIWKTGYGNNYVLLHQFRKKTKKTPAGEIRQAKIERNDYLIQKREKG